MTERIPPDDDQRDCNDCIRQAFLPQITFWDIDSECSPEGIEAAVTSM
jgi:hypothetical protein